MAESVAAVPPVDAPRAAPARRLPRFFRHRSAVIGAAIIAVVLLVAALAPFLATQSPLLLDPGIRLQPPGGSHPFGTDNFGRDVYSRVVFGARLSLLVGVAVSGLTVLFGMIIGLLAGYYPKVDGWLMRLMDGFMAFPSVILGVAIMAAMGPRVENVIVALTVVFTPQLARVVRSIVLTVRELQYVEAARTVGAGTARILFGHILPNCRSPLIVQATFIFANAVLGEASLSFLGVGVPPEIPSWGNMLGEARERLASAPWTMLAPGAALMVAVLGLNLLGDGVRDLIDPRFRKE